MPSDAMNNLQLFQQHPLFHFLQLHPCGRGKDAKEATMTGMGELTGKWHIPDEEYPKLLDLLHDYLFVQGNRALGFVEQPRLNAPKPLLIDLDFHYPKNKNLARKFTDSHIKQFCSKVAETLDYFFDMSAYQNIQFLVLLRPQPYVSGDKIKDGIHIVSPTCTLSNDKWNVIRNHLLKNHVIDDAFRDTGYMNPPEDVYDASMGRKQGWMFYGASKPSVPAYELTNVMYYDPEERSWEDEDPSNYDSRELMEKMSVRYKTEDDVNIIKDERRDEFQNILNPSATRYENQEVLERAAQVEAANSPLLQALAQLLPTAPTEMNILRQIVLECLSNERAHDHDSWMRVGWCLHNINPSEEMFDLWIEFSKKTPKWNDHRQFEVPQLRRDWHLGMRKEGDGKLLTRRSLYKWARDDNRERFKQIIDSDVCEYIILQTDTTHYHIALLMKKMWESLYVASINNRSTDWFYYDEILNMWRKLNQGMELRQKICTDVADKIQSACNIVAGRRNNGGDNQLIDIKQKQLHEMQVKLYNSGFVDSVMKMCSTVFYEEDFANKLNMNPFLFGCANGILELRHKSPVQTSPQVTPNNSFASLVNQVQGSNNNPLLNNHVEEREHVVFRQGRPEDYVSFLAGRNFPETDAIHYIPYSEFVKNQDPRLDEIQDFFRKLFPREDLRKHVLKLLASCLEGANREQLYYFFIGVGSNGKSKLVTLMKLVFGDYQTSLQATVLTRKRPESGAANPDIMAMKNRRFIYSQEPDDKEPLNTSRMKQLSGEDMVEARGLFQDQEKFKIMGKMFMMCNRLPPINAMDNGTWRRIRVIPFESRFEEADHPDLLAGKPHFFPRDNRLDEKLLTWREPFLSYLVHLYDTEYIPHGLQPEPQVVKQESEKYKADHDAFAKFRMERIREARDYEEITNEKVTLKEIKKAYDKWAMGTGARRLDMKELEQRCDDTFGEARGTNKEYNHIRVFLDEEGVDLFEEQHQNGGSEEAAFD